MHSLSQAEIEALRLELQNAKQESQEHADREETIAAEVSVSHYQRCLMDSFHTLGTGRSGPN